MTTQGESALFFNRRQAFANYDHWSKLPEWTLDQGIALLLRRNPSVVNWDKLFGIGMTSLTHAEVDSGFRSDYLQLHNVVVSWKKAKRLPDPIAPDRFLVFAKSKGLDVPTELEVCVAKYWQIVDWQARCAKLSQRVAELEAAEANRRANKWPWGNHETALLRILAIAAAKWEDYDPDKANNPKSMEIVDLVHAQLRGQGLRDSKNMADAIATIVRAAIVPDGPKQQHKQAKRKRQG